MTVRGEIDASGSLAKRATVEDWPLMPGERLEWKGRPRAFDRLASRQLARRLGLALLVGIGGTLAVAAGMYLWWPIRNQQMAGDLRPLSGWLFNLSVIAACLLALAVVGVLLVWLTTQTRLSRTRYAITDRRVIELCRHRFGTAISCLSLANAPPVDKSARDGKLVVGVSPSVGPAAAGTLITGGSLRLQRLGPDRTGALAALRGQSQERQGQTDRADVMAGTEIWSGRAIHGVIWDAKLLGQVAAILFALPFVMIGVAFMIGIVAALFGDLTAGTFESSDRPSPIEPLLLGALWVFVPAAATVLTISKALASFRNRNRRRFRVAGQEAHVVPDSPFAGAASCAIAPDMRFDLWLGRRPHLRFVGRVDESEGSKSLIRMGFDAPEDPMGAYMALVAAREAAARQQSDNAGST